jgi:hypothetical protein
MEIQRPAPRLFATSQGSVFYLYRGSVLLGEQLWDSWQVAVHTPNGQVYITDQAIPQAAQRCPSPLDAVEITRLLAEQPVLFIQSRD